MSVHAPSSPQIWLVRHGETPWSLSGQHTGRTDIDLTEAGRRRAEELGQSLAGRSFSLVLTSPLRRASDTCRLAGFGDVAVVSDDLREWDYGIYEGRTTADVRTELPDWSVWTHPLPQGESAEQVAVRARRVIELARAAPGNVVLFGHGHNLRILTACWLGLPADAGRLFALSTGSISVLGYERDTPVLLRWNEVPDEARP